MGKNQSGREKTIKKIADSLKLKAESLKFIVKIHKVNFDI